MTPSPIQRLKPYFKPRPKPGRAKPAAAPNQAQPAAAPGAAQAPAPGAPQAAAAPTAVQPVPAAPPRPPAPAAVVPPADAAALQTRREQLAGRYAELQSDLGGLVYEMAIRDHFRLDVVVRRAAELQAVDAELSSVEQRLGIATAAPATTTCQACGAAVQLGAQYCGRCGASLAQSATGPQPARAAQPSAPASAPAAPTNSSGSEKPAAPPASPPTPGNANASEQTSAPTPASQSSGGAR